MNEFRQNISRIYDVKGSGFTETMDAPVDRRTTFESFVISFGVWIH
jgi:hypothetical protein